MQVLHGIEGLTQVPAGASLTIGNFDGVHRGHQQILNQCARKDSSGVIVITFEPHPLTVLRPMAAPRRLTPPEKKLALLEQLGAEHCILLPPTPAVLSLTAQRFWEMLRDQAKPKFIIEGPGFVFGKDRQGTGELLAQWASKTAVKVELAEPVSVALLDLSLVTPSSTLIRWLVGHGRMRDAAICLGRGYGLIGKVVQGFGRGKALGVPTANLDVGGQVVPADGVYAGRCVVGGRTVAAAVSIGDMPTFNGGVRQIEAHLVDFDGDLYGQDLEIELLDWLREQRKFEGVPPLMEQIRRDIEQTRRRAAMNASEGLVEVVTP